MNKLIYNEYHSIKKIKPFRRDERFRLMASHLLYFLCKKALNILIQEAELANNIAYNQAELRIDLYTAERHSLYAIAILEFITDCVVSPNNIYLTNRKVAGIAAKRVKKLTSGENYREKYGSSLSGQEILEKLALYYDTLGWIYYRQTKYPKAADKLQVALQFNANIMPAHYHLSCVRISQYEQLWQPLNKDRKSTLTDIKSGKTGEYLRDAFYHVNIAQELDTVMRFESKNLVLKAKIQNYRNSRDDVYLDYGKQLSKMVSENLEN